jgi:2,3-bisphosphoglycerate-dependent phosphoglycerate mutase
MPIVLLIRHGESHANAGLPTAHPKTVRLTKKGLEQVENIPSALLKDNLLPDLVVYSSYARSQQTAEPTLSTFPSIPKEEWPIHEFTYLSSWHATHSTVHERRALVNEYWDNSDPTSIDAPGSESFEQFVARVEGVIERLKQAKQNIIAVFSHEQFICGLLWLLQGDLSEGTLVDITAMRDFRNFYHNNRIHNGTIVRVDLLDGLEYTGYKVITPHLAKKVYFPVPPER